MGHSGRTRPDYGTAIRDSADEGGFTLSQVSQDAGIPWNTFYRRLNGAAMKTDELERIAAALGIKPSDLMRRAEEAGKVEPEQVA